jgi:hypothetical protein
MSTIDHAGSAPCDLAADPGILRGLARIRATPELVLAVASTPAERAERCRRARVWLSEHHGRHLPHACVEQLAADTAVTRSEAEWCEADRARREADAVELEIAAQAEARGATPEVLA